MEFRPAPRPQPPWDGDYGGWFETLGRRPHPNGVRCARQLMIDEGCVPWQANMVLDFVCNDIRCDNPEHAIKTLRGYLRRDVGHHSVETFLYRILATLVTRPGDMFINPTPVTYWKGETNV